AEMRRGCGTWPRRWRCPRAGTWPRCPRTAPACTSSWLPRRKAGAVADHPDPTDLGTAQRSPRSAERPPALPQPAVVDDHTAFIAFYRAAVPDLVAFLLHHGALMADATEVAQEAMIEAFRAWPAIRNPHAWVRTVAGRKLAGRLAAVEETP